METPGLKERSGKRWSSQPGCLAPSEDAGKMRRRGTFCWCPCARMDGQLSRVIDHAGMWSVPLEIGSGVAWNVLPAASDTLVLE
jgi:hypothetical protein